MKSKRAKRFQDGQRAEQAKKHKKPTAFHSGVYGRIQNAGYAQTATPEPEYNPVSIRCGSDT